MDALDSSRRRSSRELVLPPYEAVPRTSQTYHVVGIQLHGEHDIGVSVPPADDHSIDEFPQSVHDILPDMAAETIDVDRLEAETTEESWPVVGILTLSRVDGETVNVTVEWISPSAERTVRRR